jgi:hypothetical protein
VQQPLAQITWGHNIRILDTVKNATEREWLGVAFLLLPKPTTKVCSLSLNLSPCFFGRPLPE